MASWWAYAIAAESQISHLVPLSTSRTSSMFAMESSTGGGAGGDADVRMRVEQVHEPVAPGPRLRDQQEELFRRRRGGGVQEEPYWGFHLCQCTRLRARRGFVGDKYAPPAVVSPRVNASTARAEFCALPLVCYRPLARFAARVARLLA